MPATVSIDGTAPSPDDPYIIAEIGTNHNRDIETAKELIDVATEAGVDAVKYQMYHTEDIVVGEVPASEYGFDEYYHQQTVAAVYDEHLRLPREWFPELVAYATEQGLDNIATACCADCVDFVATAGIDALKVSSQDLTHLPLLSEMATTDLPIVLSTGMGSLGEIERALQTLEDGGATGIGVLHCVSHYPTSPEDLNLRNIGMLKSAFDYTTGLSDHTLSPRTGGLAVAQGASILEKHFTLDRSMNGPDHGFALEPAELATFVECATQAADSLGTATRDPADRDKRESYRRSIVVMTGIDAGQTLQAADLGIARPGTGLPPEKLEWVVGRTTNRPLERGTVVEADDVC